VRIELEQLPARDVVGHVAPGFVGDAMARPGPAADYLAAIGDPVAFDRQVLPAAVDARPPAAPQFVAGQEAQGRRPALRVGTGGQPVAGDAARYLVVHPRLHRVAARLGTVVRAQRELRQQGVREGASARAAPLDTAMKRCILSSPHG